MGEREIEKDRKKQDGGVDIEESTEEDTYIRYKGKRVVELIVLHLNAMIVNVKRNKTVIFMNPKNVRQNKLTQRYSRWW